MGKVKGLHMQAHIISDTCKELMLARKCLTFECFQGEDLIRESGVPYTIVRPCALTEEPAGAALIFEQGDNITVRRDSNV